MTSTLKVDQIQLADGTAPTAADLGFAAGSIIQTQSRTTQVRSNTSSNSFIATDVYATITPKFTNSKILIMCSTTVSNEAAGRSLIATIYRDSTNLANDGFTQHYTDSSTRVRSGLHISYVDTPNTTSEVTYKLYYRNSQSGNVEIPPLNNIPQTMTLLEIAG